MPAEQTSQSKVPFSLTCLMVGRDIEKGRVCAPGFSFIVTLKVSG